MHVLLIHQVFVTPDRGGGTRHYEFARMLVARGHRVTVIASDVDYLTGRKISGSREAMWDGVWVKYVRTLGGVHRSFLTRAVSFMSFAISSLSEALQVRGVDVVWGTSPPLFQALTAVIVAHFKQVPFVFEVRDLWVDFMWQLGILRSSILFAVLKAVEQIAYRSANVVMVNSPGFVPYVRKSIQNVNIRVVPNGVTSADFVVSPGTRERERDTLGLGNTFTALYLGNIGVANDIEVIVEAASLLAEAAITFLFVGGGITSAKLRKMAQLRNLRNVIVHETVPKVRVPAIIAASDVCIATLRDIPLFATTYPNKVFDYMAGGRPVVLAIDGAIRAVVENARAGVFVPPGNHQALADAIRKYRDDPELAEQHGRNGREYIALHFERSVVVNQLESVLLEIVQR